MLVVQTHSLWLTAGTLLLAAGLPAAEPSKLNVLFIVSDDLRVELGCYGSSAVTPHIDGLAAQGMLFERAYCQQAVCNPSRSSFLTGRRPDTLHLWSNGIHFRDRNPDVTTLPEWFKHQGYITRNVGKIFHNWHTEVQGDRRSWSAPEYLHYANHGADKPQVDGEPPQDLAHAPRCERRDVPDEAYYDGRVAAEAVRVLAELRNEPFFLAVGFWKPHSPFNAPHRYWSGYDDHPPPPVDLRRPAGTPMIAFHDSRELLGIPPKQVQLSSNDVAEIRRGYFAGTSFMDGQVGKVLAALDELKLRDHTVIVFLSDHGYHLGEHSLWAKTSCFELDARVPLIIAPPRFANAGRRTKALAELLDLFPTLVELCGLPQPPEALDGVSLVPVLKDPAAHVQTAAFTQHPRPAYFDRTDKGVPDAMGCSVRTDRVRYTEWREWETGQILARELYDHEADPSETRNAVDDPKLAQALSEARTELLRQFPPEVAPRDR